jgi:HemY protein
MRRVLALAMIAGAVAGAVFVAGRPGHVEIVWQGWQVDTSVGVLVGAVALILLAASVVVLFAAMLCRVPRNLRRRRAVRRRRAGEAALTSGVVALAAGQPAAARVAAGRAAALLATEAFGAAPMALLVAAEAATQEGDTAAARASYTTLLERPDTEFLGLRGLIGQALRAGDDDTALRLAERARKLRPDAPWLVDAMLVLAARTGDWAAAQGTLTGAAGRRELPGERARHHRGIVLYELSRDAERSGELRRAAELAAKAQSLAADLAAPALHHARLLMALGRKRAASRTIERAWHTAPHPALARLYLEIDPDAEPLARAAAVVRLVAQNPEASESHLAVAEAALAAQLWGEARRHLGLAIDAESTPQSSAAGPSRRLCRLMARLEESEDGNMAAARGWLDRAIGAPPDPCYVCTRCGGGESTEWQALCRECGGFDTLRWQRPPPGASAIGAPMMNAGASLMLPAPAVPGARDVQRSPADRLAPPPQWDK